MSVEKLVMMILELALWAVVIAAYWKGDKW